MKKNLFIFLLLVVIYSNGVLAQDEMFKGGIGDGYVQASYLDSTSSMQKGGVGDGSDMALLETSTHSLYRGGIGDGFELAEFETSVHSLYHGGLGDGYGRSASLNSSSSLTKGGIGDGYTSDSFIKIYWTGAISSVWLLPANWSSTRLPTRTDHVVIAGGKPNYPKLGPISMIVGDVSSESLVVCKSLRIKSNGFLTSNTLSTIENYGDILIRGTVNWKNLSENAWVNKPGSHITIDNGGVLNIKAN